MLNRRRLLQTAAAAGTLAPFAACAPTTGLGGAGGNAAADTLVAEIGETSVLINPQLATNLGLDSGTRARLKSQLGAKGIEGRRAAIALNDDWLARLRAIDRSRLTGQSAVSFDVVKFQAEALNDARDFGYGDFGFVDAAAYPIQPYTLSQLTGTYQSCPDFLDTQHSVETVSDAEAYLSRLSAMAVAMDQETASSRADGARGVMPPDFIIRKALVQMQALRGAPVGCRMLSNCRLCRGFQGKFLHE